MATANERVGAQSASGVVVQGNIAARIDRLPLTRVQYLLAGITQVYWGLLIDTDGIVGLRVNHQLNLHVSALDVVK